jgi:hypothetical protein
VTDAAKLKAAKELVTALLTKQTSVEQEPALRQDDLLSISVAIVEDGDAAWLEQQLKNEKADKDARLTVALQTRGPMRKPLLKALGAPAFLLN